MITFTEINEKELEESDGWIGCESCGKNAKFSISTNRSGEGTCMDLCGICTRTLLTQINDAS